MLSHISRYPALSDPTTVSAAGIADQDLSFDSVRMCIFILPMNRSLVLSIKNMFLEKKLQVRWELEVQNVHNLHAVVLAL